MYESQLHWEIADTTLKLEKVTRIGNDPTSHSPHCGKDHETRCLPQEKSTTVENFSFSHIFLNNEGFETRDGDSDW